MTVRIVFTLSDPRLDHVLASEAAGIVRSVADKIDEGETFAALFDSKGNEVGQLRVAT